MDQRIRLDKAVAQWEGKRVEVALREEPKHRSLDQNAFIHVLARLIAQHTGETELRTKRIATLEALGPENVMSTEVILGREIHTIRGTGELRKEEASLVIDWLLEQCSFLGITAPK